MRVLACLTTAAVIAGCGGGGTEATGDSGGPDGAAEGGTRDTGTPSGCDGDEDCDNGMFCDGVERCAGGACAAGMPRGVEDGVDCTDDRCDEAADSIVNEPNDDNCAGGMACDADGNLVALTGRCDPFLDCEADPTPIMMCTAAGPSCDRAMLTTCSSTCDPVAGCGEECVTGPCRLTGMDRCEGAVHVSVSPGCSADGTTCQDTEARVNCAGMNTTFCRLRDLVVRTCTCDARGGCRCGETTSVCLTGCCPDDPRGPMCCPRIG